MGPKLIEAGHDVVGLDTGFYAPGWLFDDGRGPSRTLTPRTCARSPPADLAGFDAVVHLSELSNDPLGQHDPELTYAINHRGSVGARRGGQGGRRQALRLRLVLHDLRRRRRRACAPRSPSSPRRPPTPSARSWSSATSAPWPTTLHPDLHAQRHRLRRLAAHALRHRAEQPRRASPGRPARSP